LAGSLFSVINASRKANSCMYVNLWVVQRENEPESVCAANLDKRFIIHVLAAIT